MGLATAKLLASRGARISLADINENAVKMASESLLSTHQHIWTKVDVRDSASVDAWIDQTINELGRIDGAVNMAGIISPARPITEQTDEDFAFSLDVNAQGVFRCLRAQLRQMNEGGSIVSTIASDQLDQYLLTGSSRSQPPALSDNSEHQAILRIAQARLLSSLLLELLRRKAQVCG